MFLSLLHVNVGSDPNHPSPGRKWLGETYRIHQRLWMGFCAASRCAADEYFLKSWTIPENPAPKPKRQEAGFMFRIERDGFPRILVQSAERPNWDYAFQNAPYLLKWNKELGPKIREFEPIFEIERVYRFRLFVNVVIRKSEIHPNGKMRTNRPDMHRKRRVEIPVCPDPVPDPLPSDYEERKQILSERWNPWRIWLNEVGNKHGFRVIDNKTSPLFIEQEYAKIRSPKRPLDELVQKRQSEKRFNAGLFEGNLICTDPKLLYSAVINGIGSAKAFGFGLLSIAQAKGVHANPGSS